MSTRRSEKLILAEATQTFKSKKDSDLFVHLFASITVILFFIASSYPYLNFNADVTIFIFSSSFASLITTFGFLSYSSLLKEELDKLEKQYRQFERNR